MAGWYADVVDMEDSHPTECRVHPLFATTQEDLMFSGHMIVQLSPDQPDLSADRWRVGVVDSESFHTHYFLTMNGNSFNLSPTVEAIFRTRDSSRREFTSGFQELKDMSAGEERSKYLSPDPEFQRSDFASEDQPLGALSVDGFRWFVSFSGRADVQIRFDENPGTAGGDLQRHQFRQLMNRLQKTDFCAQYYGDLDPVSLKIRNPRGIFHYTSIDFHVRWGPLEHLSSILKVSPPLQMLPTYALYAMPRVEHEKYMFRKHGIHPPKGGPDDEHPPWDYVRKWEREHM